MSSCIFEVYLCVAVITGNPLYEEYTANGDWIQQVSNKLKNLKKLDGQFHILKITKFLISVHRM